MLLDGYQEFCGRRIMSIHKTGLTRGVLAGALLLALSCFPAAAQTPAAQSGAEQKSRVPARVTDTMDDTNRVVLRGDAHTTRVAAQRGARSGAAAIDGRAAIEEFAELSRLADPGTVWPAVWASGCGCSGRDRLADLAWVPEHQSGQGQDGRGVFRQRGAGAQRIRHGDSQVQRKG